MTRVNPGFRGKAMIAAIAAISAWPQSAFAQTLGQGVDDGISLWRVAGALLLCMGFAVAGVFVLRARMGNTSLPFLALPFAARRARRLKLVESVRVGQKADLSIVACDGRELLILVSENGSQIVREIPPVQADAVAERA